MNERETQAVSRPDTGQARLRRLAALVLTEDFRQRRRITVVLMTACIYLICAAILLHGAHGGLFHRDGAIALALVCAVTPWGFFALVRSGANLRFAKPTLALPQALCAQTLIAAAYAVSGPVHPATLVLLAMVMVFGMFEMNTASVWKLMAYSIAAIGVVMA